MKQGTGAQEHSSRPAHQANAQKKEDDERDRMKSEWLDLLFTGQSVAAMSPEGPLPVQLDTGNKSGPNSLIVWIGDQPRAETTVLKDLTPSIGSAALMGVAWSQHPAGEGLVDFNVNAAQVIDGSWYLRERNSFENTDLDMLHDVELLGRSLVETIEPKLGEYGLEWKNVILLGFGKGAGA